MGFFGQSTQGQSQTIDSDPLFQALQTLEESGGDFSQESLKALRTVISDPRVQSLADSIQQASLQQASPIPREQAMSQAQMMMMDRLQQQRQQQLMGMMLKNIQNPDAADGN